MTSDLEKPMANLSDSERDRLKGAFAADPELARGLSTMLADLPPETQAQLMRRLAARLESTPLGGGALVPALADVIQDALASRQKQRATGAVRRSLWNAMTRPCSGGRAVYHRGANSRRPVFIFARHWISLATGCRCGDERGMTGSSCRSS
jgi:diadenosine tetraphosphatase ApaH/serine/threonine PP2A family protein phosphatase